jgi:uncharacterized membrane protein YphA (DoxX/SURF4 family)
MKKEWTLLFLRISLGLLMIWWGLDKLVNVEHGVQVAEGFYLGIGAAPAVLTVFGVLQILLGIMVILGSWRRFAYPALAVVTVATALGVWKSIVDPWGWVLGRTNALFYPSLIIFAGALVMWAFMQEDTLSVDGRRKS